MDSGIIRGCKKGYFLKSIDNQMILLDKCLAWQFAFLILPNLYRVFLAMSSTILRIRYLR